MNITSVRTNIDISRALQNGHLLAFASIVIEDCLLIDNIRVIQNASRGIFVCMPSRAKGDGTFIDMVRPTSESLRRDIHNAVLEAVDKKAREKGKTLNSISQELETWRKRERNQS